MPARRKPSSDASSAGKAMAPAKQTAAVIGASPTLVTDLRQLILCRIEKWNARTLHQKIQSMLCFAKNSTKPSPPPGP